MTQSTENLIVVDGDEKSSNIYIIDAKQVPKPVSRRTHLLNNSNNNADDDDGDSCLSTFLTILVILSFIFFVFIYIAGLIDRQSAKNDRYSRPEYSSNKTTIIYNGTLPTPLECGIPYYSPNEMDESIDLRMRRSIEQHQHRYPRIVNGKEAAPHSWPWMVSLKRKSTQAHFCSGFLIYPQFVLTAGHCIEEIDSDHISVVVGLHEIDDYYYEQMHDVDSAVVHELYDPVNIRNDIGILKLVQPVQFSNEVKLCCLPNEFDSPDLIYEKDVILTGWGRIDPDTANKSPIRLQETILRVMNDNYYSCNPLNYYPDTMYCAIDPEKRQSNACNGDSGSPIVIRINGNWYAYGLTSYISGKDKDGQIRCVPTDASYYTKLSPYLNWIAWKVATL